MNMIRWMYSGNESQGIMPGDTPGVQKLLWAYPGVRFQDFENFENKVRRRLQNTLVMVLMNRFGRAWT